MTNLRALRVIAAMLAVVPWHASAQTPAPGARPTLDLTMDAAVAMALESNLGYEADRLNIDNADHAIASARAAFLPQVGAALSRSSVVSVPNDFTQGASDITSRGATANATFNHALPYFGTSYNVAWNNNRTSQIGGNPLFNPYLRSAFSFNVTQPLLRGLRTDPTRNNVVTSQRRRRVTDLQVEQQRVRLEAAVKTAYLDLISAREGLRVAQQNMDIRQATLADARARVRVGAAAPIDLITAEADVAANQEQVLVAEAQIGTREDALRTLIFDPARPDYWEVQINTATAVLSEPRAIDVDAAVKNALANRLDLIAARQELEISDLNLRVAQDAVKPTVNLLANYSTSGTGGTRFLYGQGFPPPVEGRTDRRYSSVLGDTFGAAYPQWSLGVNVAYPLGRSAQDANLAQQQVGQRQARLGINELEIAVAQQIREAARQVQSSYQRVLVTRAALAASELQLEAEQRRFAAGLATTLELQVRQSQLSTARTAELNASIAYNRALIDFDRLQQTQ